jgi:hypothetical protein
MVKPRETTWSDLKVELAQFDRAGLLGLLKDLHALNPANRAFLAARLGVGSDPLTPFKKVISRWIYPDLIKGQDVSVAKAKKAIADYRKAIGRPEGMTELCIFYCEEAARLAIGAYDAVGDVAPVSVSAVADTGGDWARYHSRRRYPAGRADFCFTLGHPSAPPVLGPADRVHPGALPGQTVAMDLWRFHAVRGRATHLHRRRLCHGRGGDHAGDAAVAVQD